jgi:hypothetical protein
LAEHTEGKALKFRFLQCSNILLGHFMQIMVISVFIKCKMCVFK